MLSYLNPQCYITQLKMLFTAANITACLVVPQIDVPYTTCSVQVLTIPAESYDLCISLIAEEKGLRLKMVDSLLPESIQQCIVYPVRELKKFNQAMPVSRFLETEERVYHLNISSLDTDVCNLASSPKMAFIKSLDLSRLQIGDSTIVEFLKTARLANLRWLDVSANWNVTIRGVEAICEAVATRRLPKLDRLDLAGTACDASPYVDGHYWRISDSARQLAKKYGYQQWMMLGSKIPELANRELLTSAQRDPLAMKFSLA